VFEYNSSLIAQGEVYSPNYPNAYPNNLNCRYEFYGRENERVIIQIEDFNLEAPQSTSLQEINFMDYVETVTRGGGGGSASSVVKGGGKFGGGKRPDLTTQQQPPLATSFKDPTAAGGQANSENNESSFLSNRQCFYDFLDVFTADGQGRLYWRSRHCGNTIDSQIVSTSPILILVFKTDRMLAYRGFKFRFHFSYINILPFVTDAVCGPAEISGNGSVLASPNYPLPFPVGVECAWTITVEPHQNILVKFVDVNLNQPCHVSHVSIWDGYVGDAEKPDFLVCEKLIYYHKGILQYKSKSNRLVIKFVGNKNMETGGVFKNKMRVTPSAANFIESSAKKNKSSSSLGMGSNYNNKIKYGFFLSWTGVHLQEPCGPAYFACKGGEYCIDTKSLLCQPTYSYCISKTLVCDGVFNCDIGDDSDEKNCELNYIRSKLYFSIAFLCGCLFLLGALCCVVFYRFNRSHQEKQESLRDSVPGRGKKVAGFRKKKNATSVLELGYPVEQYQTKYDDASAAPLPPHMSMSMPPRLGLDAFMSSSGDEYYKRNESTTTTDENTAEKTTALYYKQQHEKNLSKKRSITITKLPIDYDYDYEYDVYGRPVYDGNDNGGNESNETTVNNAKTRGVSEPPDIKIIRNSSNNSLFLSNYKSLDNSHNEEETNLLTGGNSKRGDDDGFRCGRNQLKADGGGRGGGTSSSGGNNESQLTASYDNTPTCSSSLPSESSLPSPVDSSSLINKNSSGNVKAASDGMAKPPQQIQQRPPAPPPPPVSRLANKAKSFDVAKNNILLSLDDGTAALRRNSYTRAIFSENSG
jgi:hypothetical protein